MLCNAIESTLSIRLPTTTCSTTMSCAFATMLLPARSATKSIDFKYLTVLFEFQALLATILKLCNSRLVVVELSGSEETVNLYNGILNRIGSMYHILLTTHREVATDCAGERLA